MIDLWRVIHLMLFHGSLLSMGIFGVWKLHTVLSKGKELSSSIQVEFKHEVRSANGMADNLAKQGVWWLTRFYFPYGIKLLYLCCWF